MSDVTDVVDVTVIPTGSLSIKDKNFDAEAAIALVEKRAKYYQRVKVVSLAGLSPKDFMDEKGTPYLQSKGAERLQEPWGLYTKDMMMEPRANEVRRLLAEGKQVTVEVMGTIGSHVTGEESVFYGARSSDDEFYQGQQDKLGSVDPGDLCKAAISNWFATGVARLLGLRGLTWEELKSLGFTPDKAAATVKYDRKTPDDASLANKIWKACLDLNGGNEDAAKDYLEQKSAFVGKDGKEVRGIRSFKGVSEKRLQVIWAEIKKDLKDMGVADDEPF